jgi:hypothetical protein
MCCGPHVANIVVDVLIWEYFYGGVDVHFVYACN